jgi:GTP-binding protein Era
VSGSARGDDVRRTGTVALVGRPSAGKSTLLNALVGEKVAIVSSRPQTTRNRLVGILNEPRGQVVFFDLPGVHRPLHKMNAAMMQTVREALGEVDVVLHLLDASQRWGYGEEYLFELLQPVAAPVIGVLTKVDLVRPKSLLLPLLNAYRERRPGTVVVPIAAPTGDGLEELRGELFTVLPAGEPLYPPNLTTTQSERFFIAEMVREKVLQLTRDELAFATGVVVEQHEEGEGLLRVGATIYVEREGQKGILIGRRGQMIKAIGQAARAELERRLGIRLFLELRVKVHSRWRDDPRLLVAMTPGEAHLEPWPDGGGADDCDGAQS